MTAHHIPVGLSTASVYPLSVAQAFSLAADVGYDGMEVMVSNNETSQSAEAINELSAQYHLPVLSVHAPTLLVSQRVWGPDAWGKVVRSANLARQVGAGVVVVHPPFRWQRGYAENFADGVRRISLEFGVTIAVENMFPWRFRGREIEAYLPSWNTVEEGYPDVTYDLSHAAVSGSDAVDEIRRLGPRLSHVHLADGTGSLKDEHRLPGQGNQPCGTVLEMLADRQWDGAVVAEINTRKARAVGERESWLRSTLEFARNHLRQPVPRRR